MADNSSKKQAKLNFRQKAARVYKTKDEAVSAASSLIDIDRSFTVTFSEEERSELEAERSQIRGRLTGMRR